MHTERNYVQLDKEPLSIVFGVMYGRQFTIICDHKPLKYILGETRGISPLAQRWALTLSAYSYTICFKPGADNGNADGLNCSVPNHIKEVSIPGMYFYYSVPWTSLTDALTMCTSILLFLRYAVPTCLYGPSGSPA